MLYKSLLEIKEWHSPLSPQRMIIRNIEAPDVIPTNCTRCGAELYVEYITTQPGLLKDFAATVSLIVMRCSREGCEQYSCYRWIAYDNQLIAEDVFTAIMDGWDSVLDHSDERHDDNEDEN